jgi:hypothetical protein
MQRIVSLFLASLLLAAGAASAGTSCAGYQCTVMMSGSDGFCSIHQFPEFDVG